MPRFPVSPYWSSNPNIPIYLDRGEEGETEKRQSPPTDRTTRSPHPKHAPEYICPTCETSSRDTPIHCVSVSPSPAPPSYSSIASPPPPPSPRHLAVPVLTIETPRNWSKPQAPIRSLQFDPEGRPNVRFRRNAFSPLSPAVTEFDEVDWSRKSPEGLGIREVPLKPDASPITPGTIEKRGEEDPAEMQHASNFAQRVEQKLWAYTASRNVMKRWLLELISWSISAACMAGIVGMLMGYQNKRIPNWPFGLTLNAYISVLAKIASAALLLPVSEALGQLKWSWFQGDNSKKMWDFEIFDNASRGPWGSLLLIIRTKGRSLAALGAAVTLMALALDPFFQQVVEYPEHWRLQPGKGHIPRALGYSPFSFGQEFQQGLLSLEYDQTLVGITFQYFYGNGTMPMTFGKGARAEVPLVCPNSNCTWPEYETLGVHSECVEAADRLEFKCLRSSLDWVQNPNTDPNQKQFYTFDNGTACGWWLKADDPLLMSGYAVDRKSNHSGEVLIERAQPLYNIDSRNFVPGYEPKLNNSRNPLAHVMIVSGQNVEGVRQNSTPIAHECMISWAAKRIISTYSEGGYSENIVSTLVNSTVTDSPWKTTTIPNDDPLLVMYDYNYKEDITLVGHNDTVYVVDNYTHSATVMLFDDIFPSFYAFDPLKTEEEKSEGQQDVMLRYKTWKKITPYMRSMPYNAFLYDNVTAHFESMAVAITNALRSAEQNTTMVEGEAFDLESFVDVRWAWMTLPLGLLVFTGIFLFATIFRSSREQDHVGVWKTSAIATLLYGLPDDMSKKMTSSKVQGTPRAKAKEVRVKWIPKRGWRFSGMSISPTSLKTRSSTQQWS